MQHTLQMAGSLAPRESWTAEECTIAKALEIVSTRTAFLILREAFYGTTRFDDFADSESGSPSRSRPRAFASWWTTGCSSARPIATPASARARATG